MLKALTLFPLKICNELKTKIGGRRPSNLEELERFIKEQLFGIAQETCETCGKLQKKGRLLLSKKRYTSDNELIIFDSFCFL